MKKTVKEMSTFELGRWLALVEAVNIIAEECQSRKISFNKIQLEPLTIRKYVEGTCDIFCRKLENSTNQNNIGVLV